MWGLCLQLRQRKLFSPAFLLRNASKLQQLANSASTGDTSTAEENEENDFFGIIRSEGVKEVIYDEKSESKKVDVVAKYDELTRKPRTDKVFNTMYGLIRFDTNNKPKYHGEFSDEKRETYEDMRRTRMSHERSYQRWKRKTSEKPNEEDNERNLNEFIAEDGQNKISYDLTENELSKEFVENFATTEKESTSDEINERLASVVAKEKYEVVAKKTRRRRLKPQFDETIETNFPKTENVLNEIKSKEFKLENEIEKQLESNLGSDKISSGIAKNKFETDLPEEIFDLSQSNGNKKGRNFYESSKSANENEMDERLSTVDEKEKSEVVAKKSRRQRLKPEFDEISETVNAKNVQKSIKSDEKTAKTTEPKVEKSTPKTKQPQKEMKNSKQPTNGLGSVVSVKDFVENKRKEQKEQDITQGRVVCRTTNFFAEPESAVLETLKASIIYNENDIVAINKPYGLPCQPGQGHHHYLQKYLSELAKFIDKDLTLLHAVHRLDIGTTGVLLLAKTQQMADVLNSLFKSRQIQKTYWAITKGVPDPPAGIINIPIAEGMIGERRRMVLKPDFTEVTKHVLKKSSIGSFEAITEYQILQENGHSALVEVLPKTGVTHQLRVHLGLGLGTPVLGDHKYSYLTKLAPQKLHGDTLRALQVRQTKVRDLPIHLHARIIVIPQIYDGRNVVIKADLPDHFRWAMQRLKLSRRSR